jgi:amidophosphoribosyltransferase
MCGVIGVISPPGSSVPAAFDVLKGLLTLQHRGQDAAGILAYDFEQGRFFQRKDLGLVATVFNTDNMEKLPGQMAIGHNRYATTGSNSIDDIQPMLQGFPLGIGMAHNGNIVNYHSKAKQIQIEKSVQLLTQNDVELIMRTWTNAHMGTDLSDRSFSLDKAVMATKEVFKSLIGGYGVVSLIAGEGLMAFRDPQGIRPLILGERLFENGKKSYCVCSESVSLNFLGYDVVRDIAPGEFLFIDTEGVVTSRFPLEEAETKKQATCMFEWIYFAAAESTIETKSIYGARLNLGKQLAKKVSALIEKGKINPDVVMPVPDTSRTAAISLAEELKLPYREGLIKNRYIQRSFILSNQGKREKAVELKLGPIPSEIKGKNILLVDDSIVRGTTSKKIVSLLKKYGAKNITLAITCPPIKHPCFYGVDFPNPKELVATNKSPEELSNWIGLNRVIFLDIEDLHVAIGTTKLCTACVSNDYPTDILEGEEFGDKRNETRVDEVSDETRGL